MKRLVGLALVGSLALAGAPAAIAKSSHPAVVRVKVKITDFKFTPTPLAIKKGNVVVWVNNGPSTHTTTSDTGKWDSGPLTVGTKFHKRFRKVGTFTYHCSIHPFMTGEIDVSA